MSKVRVYEVAKQLNMDRKELVALFQSLGLADVKNHMSAVDTDVVDRVKRHLEKAKAPSVVEERIRSTVIRRRGAVKADPPSTRVPAAEGSRDNGGFDAVGPPSARPSVARPSVARPSTARPSTAVEAEAPAPPAPPSARPSARRPAASAASAATPVPAPPPSRSSTKRALLDAPPPVLDDEPPPSTRASARVALPAAPEAPVAELRAPEPEPEAPVARPAPAAERPSRSKATPEPEAAPPTQAAPEPPPVAEPPAPAPVAAPAAAAAAPAAEPPAPAPPPPSPPPAPAPVESKPALPLPPPSPPVRPVSPARPAPAPAAAASTTTSRPAMPVRPAAPVPKKTGIEVWAGRPGVPMPPPPQTSTPGGRRTTYDMRSGPAATPARPGMPMNRPGGPGGRPGMGRPGMMGNRGRPGMGPIRKGPAAVSTKEMGADKKVIRIEEKVSLQMLAARMSLKATEVLMKLIQLGMTGVNINTTLDADTAKIVAGEFGWEVEDVALNEATQLSQARGAEAKDEGATDLRAPIITVMGHVDHGKTSLLDQIRKTNVAGGEAGGITQHIGAYRVQTSRGPICFLDTPGHEAFTAMRARGAGVTDIVVLVVAADDGVMPQTREAVAHAISAKVPIVVAVNKIDKPEADLDRVKRQLMELNAALVPEEYGGNAAYMPVSAKTRQGVDELLERLALEAEVLELRANPKRPGHGTVIEALLDRGKGPVARILVTDGTLNTGDYVLAGPAFGKIRAMTDDRGRAVTTAGPATPVEVLGLTQVPNAGDAVDAVKDPKKAQEIADARAVKQKGGQANAKVTLEDLARRAELREQVELRIIVKADVQGSVEALSEALQRLTGDKVKLTIVQASVGAITEGDINLAIASKALVIGFNVRPAGKSASLAESEGIEIRQYNIIYNVIDDVRGAMEGLLAPTLVEKPLGKAEVRQVFKLSKSGIVAGCMITEGSIKRSAKARVRRGTELAHEGKIVGLKRFKEDVREVNEGFECGISLENFDTIKEGDIIEAFEVEEVRTKL